ncbi:MAG TPA: cytochrome c oxidase assembly protein [Longimicrobiales bacterium]|nr:cytochrome c oxidase assembly protein [Longimicrobiales bacterium]
MTLATLALLHGGEFSWTSWEIHESTLIGCLLWVGAYLYGIGPGRRRFRLSEQPADPLQVIAFVGGTLFLFLSLNGPLHDLSDNYLFSAHMVQHLVITLIVPPLWLMGLPAWLVRPVLRLPGVAATARVLASPLVAFGIYNLVFIGWHFPFLYNWALVQHNAHILQHIMFITAAAIMWYPVINPLPELQRMQAPVGLLYLALFSIPMSIVSAIITLAAAPLYPWYEAAPRVFELSALDDQQLGGAIMWVPGMIVFWIVITILFFRWSNREDREEAQQRERLADARGAR